MDETKQQDPPQFNKKPLRTFDELPQGVRDWVGSDAAGAIIVELNDRAHLDGGFLRVTPRLITRLLLGMLAPEDFQAALSYYLPLTEPKIIGDLSLGVKNRILKPIANSLTGLYAIDIEKIITHPTAPVARTMKLEGVPAPLSKPTVAPRVIVPAVPTIKARVTEMQHVIDLRPPEKRETALAGAQRANPPAAAGPKATITEMARPFTAPADAPEAAATTKPAPTEKKPDVQANVLEAQRPFGLAEVVPKAPAPQEIERYADQHPAVEKKN